MFLRELFPVLLLMLPRPCCCVRSLRFNLGVVLSDTAVSILQKDTGNRTVEQVQEAVRRLRLASPIISWLAKEQRTTGIAIIGPGTSSGGSLRHATAIEAGEGSGSGSGDAAKVYNVGVAYNLKRCRDRAQHLQVGGGSLCVCAQPLRLTSRCAHCCGLPTMFTGHSHHRRGASCVRHGHRSCRRSKTPG